MVQTFAGTRINGDLGYGLGTTQRGQEQKEGRPRSSGDRTPSRDLTDILTDWRKLTLLDSLVTYIH